MSNLKNYTFQEDQILPTESRGTEYTFDSGNTNDGAFNF